MSSYGPVPLKSGQHLHHSALYAILRQPNHCCSRLCSVWMANDSYCRWTAVWYTWSVRHAVQSAVLHGKKWRRMNIVAWQRGGTPVVPILIVQSCAAPCGAAECSWFGTVRPEQLLTRWDTAVSLKRRFYSSTPAAEGWQEDSGRTKGSTHSLHAPVLPFVLSYGSFLSPNFPLITFYSGTLTRWKKDAAPTLQVVSREVHA